MRPEAFHQYQVVEVHSDHRAQVPYINTFMSWPQSVYQLSPTFERRKSTPPSWPSHHSTQLTHPSKFYSLEGRVYWFNTAHFSRSDINRMPYFEARKLSRRAVNYLLLGLSLPPILDVNSTPFEYLRALNALLLEFEAYQQVHPPDGSSSSSLARARIPQMFKRAAHAGTKTRRTSSATEIGLPMQTSDPSDLKNAAGNNITSPASAAAASMISFPLTESSDLLPGEEYTYLLTPSLPFEPDFFETFATLCDVLIDCYTRILSLVNSPATCTVGLGELFSKADAKLRKIMVAGAVREFEDASRNNVKNEISGVSRVVLGGLMG